MILARAPLALGFCLALAACSPTELAPPPDAAADVGVDAEPCAGACGPGTVCEAGRCVAADAGTGDASTTTDAIPADACTRGVWVDMDGDGFGMGNPQLARCDAVTPGFAMRGGDCDDGNPAAYPGATERCDGVDTDCNGFADDDPLQVRNPDGTSAAMHPLSIWCEAQLRRPGNEALRERVMRYGSLRRCLSARLVPSSAAYLSEEPRCFAGSSLTENACWRETEIPCR